MLMAIVNVYAALVVYLQNNKTYLNGLTLRLFQNNHTPDGADVAGDYTEATFSGYAAVALNNWGNAFQNGSDQGEIDETVRIFTCTGPSPSNAIYGYYVTDGSGNLVWAERNPAGPVTINTAGQTYSVLPRQTAVNQ